MKNIFNATDVADFTARINALSPDTKPVWGKMSADQMLAHCNVAYEMAFENKYPKIGAFKKFMLKLFVKEIVVGDKPYTHNSRTAPEFLISDTRKFDLEKKRLMDYISKTQQLGESYFEGKESRSFGPLSAKEWNNMFSKHLEHHLTQFGV